MSHSNIRCTTLNKHKSITIEVPNKDGCCRLDCLDVTGSVMLLVWLASTSEPDKLECICVQRQ